MGEEIKRIYARNTIVKKLEIDEAQKFVHTYHKQGSAQVKTSIISYGLIFNDELVAVAQFCSPRTAAKKRNYSTELLRLCFKDDTQVIGGASKLIKNFIKLKDPSDIFTYQDTTGENSKVYEYCGFTLVSQDKRKQYLIAPHKTFETADRKNAEILSFSYASSYGPDNLLGVSLGEQFKDDGSRKTNIELFQDLGWTVAETTGDKVYEWINQNRTYYTYKITADGSDKYYYGVSHVKIANATIDDCLKHNYFGSGGLWVKNNKFNNWKNKYKASLKKEVIKTFSRKSKAYDAEKKLVGDLWKNDPLCLNTIAGGAYTGIGQLKQDNISLKTCSIHGETKHIGDKCRKCINAENISMKECEIHGLTKHNGQSCSQCVADKNVSLKECLVHGETKHLGFTCQKCRNDDLIVEKECELHGLTKHRKDTCYKCLADKNISLKECLVHGLTKHHGDKCSTCIVENAISIKNCEIHGLTKHYGDSCNECRSAKAVRLKNCSVHGEAKHIGEQCYKCRNSGYVLDNCEIHGETSFQGGKCHKCSSNKLTVMKECNTHGLTKHRGDICALCRSQNSVDLRDCLIHGLTKHRGKSCSKCTADKAAHRYHIEEKGKTKENCSLCDKEIQEGARKPLVKKVVELRECPLCENKFSPKNQKQLFCQNPHPLNCVSCEDNIMPVPRKDKKFYSCRKRECINEATRLSTLDKYGVENVSQLDSVREKISASKK